MQPGQELRHRHKTLSARTSRECGGYRCSSGRLPEIERDLMKQKVDIVFVPNSQGARELQKVSKRIPIIFVSGELVKTGLADSMAKPGRNATGFS